MTHNELQTLTEGLRLMGFANALISEVCIKHLLEPKYGPGGFEGMFVPRGGPSHEVTLRFTCDKVAP